MDNYNIYKTDPKDYLRLFQSGEMSYNDYFEISCFRRDFKAIDYLLTDGKNKSEKNKHQIIFQAIMITLHYQKLDVLDYLRNKICSDTEITQEQIRNENFKILDNSCLYGYLNTVDYIFKNPKVDGEIFNNYEENINKLFLSTIYQGNTNLIQYFIFEYDIKKTEKVETLLLEITEPERKYIEKLFELNQLNKSLHNDLKISQDNNHIKKTKI